MSEVEEIRKLIRARKYEDAYQRCIDDIDKNIETDYIRKIFPELKILITTQHDNANKYGFVSSAAAFFVKFLTFVLSIAAPFVVTYVMNSLSKIITGEFIAYAIITVVVIVVIFTCVHDDK